MYVPLSIAAVLFVSYLIFADLVLRWAGKKMGEAIRRNFLDQWTLRMHDRLDVLDRQFADLEVDTAFLAKGSARVMKTPDHKCSGWEIVCPDGHVRDYPYHNKDDAEARARRKTQRRCQVYKKPNRLQAAQPPCPEGQHQVRPVNFSCSPEKPN